MAFAAPDTNLHNIQPTPQSQATVEEASEDVEPFATGTTATVVPSTESSSISHPEGTWGERDVGGPVSHRVAMEDYEEMCRELTHLSRTPSNPDSQKDPESPFRTLTGRSTRSGTRRARRARTSSTAHNTSVDDKDLEFGATGNAGDAELVADKEEDFELGPFIREGYFEKRTDAGASAKKVGVVFKNLTVKGVGSAANYVQTLPNAILGTFDPDLYRMICNLIPSVHFDRHQQMRTLTNDFTGIVRDGEMMLVLGRPGSGCTTFLKAIANQRGDYAEVTGDVSYGGIPAEKQRAHYRGEVSYNPEDDQHFPALNVWQTLKFSLLNKTKRREKREINIIIEALLKMFGIVHTDKTLVGNEFVRGISGGERKRVSIAETLATKSAVVCWDNSTRGLDASTALDYANSLRIMTDVSDRTTLVTLYQAGESIYELMDKVVVIEEGRMIYQGPANEAKEYMIDLGFHCPERETTADFLTAVTDPKQRIIREGYESRVPKTPEDFEKAFRTSETYQRVLADVADYESHLSRTDYRDAREFKESV